MSQSLSNQEWTSLFETAIAELKPVQEVKVVLDDKRPAFVRLLLIGQPGIKTSILVPKASIVGESRRTVLKVVNTALSAIGVESTLPDEPKPNAQEKVRPNADGSMSPAEAARMRGMFTQPNLVPQASTSHNIETGDGTLDDDVAFGAGQDGDDPLPPGADEVLSNL